MASPSTTIPVMTLVAVLALILGSACRVDAAVATTTCQAAAAKDMRVNLPLCESLVGGDAWSLARDASSKGMHSSAVAAEEIKTQAAGSLGVMKAALLKCGKLYAGVAPAFAQAADEINRHNLKGGRFRLDAALAQGQQCDATLKTFGVTPPQHTVESVQMAIIARAIVCTVDANTCRGAVDGRVACIVASTMDAKVNLQQCESLLGATKNAEFWNLAKDASDAGMFSAAQAGNDVKILLADSSSVAMKPALDKCTAAYSKILLAFAKASQEISLANYVEGRNGLNEAMALTQQCNAAFGAQPPQPLAQHADKSIQMAIIAAAITNLTN